MFSCRWVHYAAAYLCKHVLVQVGALRSGIPVQACSRAGGCTTHPQTCATPAQVTALWQSTHAPALVVDDGRAAGGVGGCQGQELEDQQPHLLHLRGGRCVFNYAYMLVHECVCAFVSARTHACAVVPTPWRLLCVFCAHISAFVRACMHMYVCAETLAFAREHVCVTAMSLRWLLCICSRMRGRKAAFVCTHMVAQVCACA